MELAVSATQRGCWGPGHQSPKKGQSLLGGISEDFKKSLRQTGPVTDVSWPRGAHVVIHDMMLMLPELRASLSSPVLLFQLF